MLNTRDVSYTSNLSPAIPAGRNASMYHYSFSQRLAGAMTSEHIDAKVIFLTGGRIFSIQKLCNSSKNPDLVRRRRKILKPGAVEKVEAFAFLEV